MTSIKLPGHVPAPLPEATLDGPDALGRAAGTGATSDAAGVDAVSGAPAGAAVDVISQIAQSLQSGALSMDEAMAQLLDHAVAGIQGHLTEPERADLLALLRDALVQDPALGALRETLR